MLTNAMAVSTINNLFGLVVFAAVALHMTVSFRNAAWLPAWLGRGLPATHRTAHAKVAFANLVYATGLAWLVVRPYDPRWSLLDAAMILAAMFALIQGLRRARQASGF